MIPGIENKTLDPSAYSFEQTGATVGDHKHPYSYVQKSNAQKQTNPDTVYVEITTQEQKTRDNFFVAAAISEFYRDLSPPETSPKMRVKVDAQGKPLTLLSKVMEDFEPAQSSSDASHILNSLIAAAPHLALIPFIEEFDLHTNNINKSYTKRIDFDQSAIAFLALGPEYGAKYSESFVGKKYEPPYFLIDPVDIETFPNLIFMKPWNFLFFKKKNKSHTDYLNNASKSSEFNKVIHQYFLKALLFDKNIMKASFAAHIPDTARLEEMSDYFDKRFKALKFALVQSPKFRESIKDHFDAYKENILKEINKRNEEFIKKQEKHQGEPLGDKYKYYTSRIIDINSVTAKLDELRTVFCDIDPVLFQTSFNIPFDPKNKFHHYAMQLCQASDLKPFDAQQLLVLTKKKIQVKLAHLVSFGDSFFEQVLANNLRQIRSGIDNIPALAGAEILFYADTIVSDMLIKKERQEKYFNYYEEIEESFFNHFKEHASALLACNQGADKADFLFKKLFSQDQVNYYEDDLAQELSIFQFKKLKQEIQGNKNNISRTIEAINPVETLYPIIIDQRTDEYEGIDFPQERTQDIINKKQFFKHIDHALQTCIDYADQVKNKELAVAYLNKVNDLCNILQNGLSNHCTLQVIATKLQSEIEKPDEFLYEHNGLKAIFLWFVNLFRSAESITASAKPIFSWLNTKRANLLNNITEVFVEEGVGPRLDR